MEAAPASCSEVVLPVLLQLVRVGAEEEALLVRGRVRVSGIGLGFGLGSGSGSCQGQGQGYG